MELYTRNVNSAFRELVEHMERGLRSYDTSTLYLNTRPVVRKPYSNPNGSGVRIQIDEPVMIHYSHPKERVLFNEARDANPFFHLYEALWMLAGRNDVAPLAYYNSKVGGYSDDGNTFNGAYGYRWMKSQGRYWQRAPYGPGDDPAGWPMEFVWRDVDQLQLLINHLKVKPESSRAVLAMWNVEDDLLKIDSCKDVCCNLDVVFSIRQKTERSVMFVDGANQGRYETSFQVKYLDMTVFNRSNDLIWGALGANYVHFTVLQEYVAAHLGVEVGRYTQATTNLHVYDWNWKPEEWLAERTQDAYLSMRQYNEKNPGMFKLVPLVKNPEEFDHELPLIVDAFKGEVRGPRREIDELTEPFFRHVAGPMFRAFELHKIYRETETAIRMCDLIQADDWRVAATNWLKKRVK